jgi:hypothetical protein
MMSSTPITRNVAEAQALFFEHVCAELRKEVANVEERRAQGEQKIAEVTAAYFEDYADRITSATTTTFSDREADDARAAAEDARFDERTKTALLEAARRQAELAAARAVRTQDALKKAVKRCAAHERTALSAFIARAFSGIDYVEKSELIG